MGPPEFTGGNLSFKVNYRIAPKMLQWGRRNSPAETRDETIAYLHDTFGLQWAAGIHRRKRWSGRCR